MNSRQKRQFDILAQKMDARQEAINKARKIAEDGKELPAEYKYLEQYFNEIPWRQDKKILNTIIKAAKKSAQNEKKREDRIRKGIKLR